MIILFSAIIAVVSQTSNADVCIENGQCGSQFNRLCGECAQINANSSEWTKLTDGPVFGGGVCAGDGGGGL